MSELKPCPFCGGRAEHEIFHDGFFMMCRVTCGKCGAEITRVYEFGDEAIEAWNRRADFSNDFTPQKDDFSKEGGQ